ncbi:MAG: L,D-transpeptidase/peptidoglycan binding protein [Patulibacter sp.]|nr:L,D-transpeptidase/peptidoglycan binding protein [Patulibacter sp.]
MSKRIVIALSSVLLAVLIMAGTVLVADAAGPEKIPNGVTIGGVDVGGLTGEQARERVDRQLLGKLSRPIRVTHKGRSWTLTPASAKIRVHFDGAIEQAIQLGETGNAFSRVYRRLTGERTERDLDTRSTYSKAGLTRLLDRVQKGVARDPKDASVELVGAKLELTKSRDGLRLDRDRVASRVRKALLNPSAPSRVRAATIKRQPTISTAKIRAQYKTALVANRGTFKLTLYKNLKPVKSYGISVGKAGNDTPAGKYAIQNKAVNPAWNVPQSDWAGDLAGTVVPGGVPENPLKARWMGIYDGVGIHGTSDDSSIGTNASHGCLRMHVPDVIELYSRVPVGTPIWIV